MPEGLDAEEAFGVRDENRPAPGAPAPPPAPTANPGGKLAAEDVRNIIVALAPLAPLVLLLLLVGETHAVGTPRASAATALPPTILPAPLTWEAPETRDRWLVWEERMVRSSVGTLNHSVVAH